jgi:hypothetical protein
MSYRKSEYINDDIEGIGVSTNKVFSPSELSRSSKDYKIPPMIFYSSILSTSLFILASLFSLVLYLLNTNHPVDSFSILTFKFNNPNMTFQTHPASFIICLIVLILLSGLNIYAIVDFKDEVFRNIFSTDFNFFYAAINLCLSIMFFHGLIIRKDETDNFVDFLWAFIFYSLLLPFSLILYRKIKIKRNFSLISQFSQNIYVSFITSLSTYLVLYSLMNFILSNIEKDTENYNEIKSNLSITADCVYAAVAVVCITIYKDLVFPLVVFILEIGYLFSSENLPNGNFITSWVILGFLGTGMIATVYRYKKLTFGYEDTNELILSLQRTHDLSSNSNK